MSIILPQAPWKRVKAAGKYLAGPIPAERKDFAIEIFGIAHEWRASHIGPLRAVRQEMVGKLRKLKLAAPTASRLKRMTSMRSKLAKGTVSLHEMQDVAGCRVILPTMKEVGVLAEHYRAGGSKHRLLDDVDYIQSPKPDGYRCLHLVFRPDWEPSKSGFKGQRVEMQVRSQLQHSWATSVEAVGLYRGEDLKGGVGDGDWLRFFELMSSELATEEACPLVPNTVECAKGRRAELLSLNEKLSAVETLDAINKAVNYTEDPEFEDAEFFLIQYDQDTTTVTVRRYSEYSTVSDQYIKAEQTEGRKKQFSSRLMRWKS